VSLCHSKRCRPGSASRAVDRLESGSESMVLVVGYVSVEISLLSSCSRWNCRKSRLRSGGCMPARISVGAQVRKLACQVGSRDSPRSSHDRGARANYKRERLGCILESSGVRSSIIATDARRAFTSKTTIAPGTRLESRSCRDPCPQ